MALTAPKVSRIELEDESGDPAVVIVDARDLKVVGRVGGRGPQWVTVGPREFWIKREVRGTPHPGSTVLRRSVVETDASGRRGRREQLLDATEVPAGTFAARQQAHERREARLAKERELASRPQLVDMLADLVALKGREPSLTVLAPDLPSEQLVAGARLLRSQVASLVVEPEAPRHGIDGAWDYLCATRGIQWGLSTSGRPFVRASKIRHRDREVIEALGEDVILGILTAKPLRCDLPHKGDAPLAFTIAWPNRLPVCEDHLRGTAGV